MQSQMARLKAQREKSFKRNQLIKKQMIEFESTLANVTAKTERLRILKVGVRAVHFQTLRTSSLNQL